ncbi:MAG: 3-methyl-2-oxobutanoate hydroxymethyltransferase [Proteobacteria bacterium]|nr:3-methyl-2-oxobutanoate hydroxymethyltransferase [Pseudomonadota bacterium]MBU1137785.1 3-methyl-2-oxobutanoate hydroxymethyltransferase [Pseudomonadota bacterium]MBU1419142.1 3-methyl-2-oxobutanoate hydroxymethyltransferase [Pseudomonadota bacterium]MBU1455100.1 3-methyl-2-oxobutanoate hydroxymethyltransferase [Pseudomonadota bacterium]
MQKRKTVLDILTMKKTGEKITMLTAYDAAMASLLASADVDMLLVGDSLGMVVLGYDSTVPVTMDEMIHHASAVRRGAPGAFVVADLPFGSYQTGIRDALINGSRFLKEAGCDAVKLEGGLEVCDTVAALVRAGISVMGHIGLTPQTATQLGGYKVQGRDLQSAKKMVAEALALEKAGAFAIVMECIPDELGRIISEEIAVPTIGIGAGVHCDGQVLVVNDLLGMFEKFIPSFVKSYCKLAPTIKEAVAEYNREVRSGAFPDKKHSFSSESNLRELLGLS